MSRIDLRCRVVSCLDRVMTTKGHETMTDYDAHREALTDTHDSIEYTAEQVRAHRDPADAKLWQAIDDYESGRVTVPGPARQARHMLKVPAEYRAEVGLLSNYIMNTSPGYRPSDATAEAVRIFAREGIEGVRKR